MPKRRASGSVRKLPSGRWQARVRDLDGRLIAIGTFETKGDASHAVTAANLEVQRGGWFDPDAGQIRLRDYAQEWLANHPRQLRPRTVELSEQLLRVHINPSLGDVPMGRLTTARVRTWHAELRTARSEAVAARSYRLLRAILATAVEDERIAKNPCTIRGAGTERTSERPVASIPQVYAFADAAEPRFRALILTAAFASLRSGELFALRRRHVDLEAGTITVEEQLHSLRTGEVVSGPPKSDAGRRVVAIPGRLVPELAEHLERYAAPGPDGLVFTGAKGAALRRSHWGLKWRALVGQVGMGGFRFHDLRHTGNTLAAATGASTRELMARMGHSSVRAALIYQHATRDRDEAIAKALDTLIDAALGPTEANSDEAEPDGGSTS